MINSCKTEDLGTPSKYLKKKKLSKRIVSLNLILRPTYLKVRMSDQKVNKIHGIIKSVALIVRPILNISLTNQYND